MVHSPEYLNDDRQEKVYIMAAGGLDDIFKIINKKYPLIKNVAILHEDTIGIANEK